MSTAFKRRESIEEVTWNSPFKNILPNYMTRFDLTKQVNLLLIHHNQSSLIQTNETGVILPLTKNLS